MTKQKLPLEPVKRVKNEYLSGSTGVVVLERSDDQEITLRFLNANPEWGSRVKEVKLDFDLAEQLQRLLAAELEDY